MRNALDDIEISDECSVAIEYQIPLTAKRVDFLIGGVDEFNNNSIVVIELKHVSLTFCLHCYISHADKKSR